MMPPLNRRLLSVLILGLVVIALIPAGACRKSQEQAVSEDELSAEEQAAEEEAAAKAAAAKVVPPKVNEEIYIEMRARSVLIRQKYAEDPATAEKEVEALLEKSNLVFADLTAYETKIGPANLAQLESKIQEKMQKLLDEYR